MWLKNFFKELKAWRVVKQVYKENKNDFEKLHIHCDWFGRLYVVINRDTEVALGSDEDKVYLQNDLSKIWNLMVVHNIADILAYDLKPLENEQKLDDGKIEYEHGYLVILTPAWNMDKQYVTWKSVLSLIVLTAGIIFGIIYSIVHFL